MLGVPSPGYSIQPVTRPERRYPPFKWFLPRDPERKNPDGTCARVGDEALRAALAAAVHLPDWRGQVTPHLLRHFCTSQQL